MTREEAIEILQGAIKKPNTKDGYLGQAIDIAIKALGQESSSSETPNKSETKIDCEHTDCNNCVNHKYCDYESNKSEIPTGSTTKNDLGVREFEEIVVEYPPEDLCTYPEYKGKPYLSIKYKEGNDCSVGYGTYNPKVFSRYLRDYFMPLVTPQEPRWIPTSERYPRPDDEYKLFLVTDDKGKVSVQEFYLSLDEEPQPYFGGMTNVVAWMPLPNAYKEVDV